MKDFKYKVSVIVPIYNVEKYLSKCVESLLNQTLREIQIILVNDGSTDKSGEIAGFYANSDDRVVMLHKVNGGISSARSLGLQYATGEYVTFVDSDDWVDDKMYETMWETAQKTNSDIVSTSLKISEMKVVESDILKEYLTLGDVSMCNKIFKLTQSIKENFQFDPKDVSIDIKGCYDMFKHCQRWTILPGAYYNYRQDNISYGRCGFNLKQLNAVRLTELVAADAKTISQEAYEAALLHTIHAKFDIYNVVAMFGFRDEESRKIFKELRKVYQKDIRRMRKKILKTEYFSKEEKYQLFLLSFSSVLFIWIKKIYRSRVLKNGAKVASVKI